jgi:hypothetical protein
LKYQFPILKDRMHCSQGFDVEKTAGDKTTIFGVPLTGHFNHHCRNRAGLHMR